MSKKLCKIMQKLTTVAIALALVLSTMSPANALAAVKVPTLNETSVTIAVGKKFDFDVKETVKGASYEWSVANDKVLAIDQNGVITGLREGKTNITCKMKLDGKVYPTSARVTVLKPAAKVTITNPVETLNVKQYYKLKAKLTPVSSNETITWSSSDKDIAVIDPDGSFVIKKEGTVTITATTISGKKDSVTIYVGAEALANKDKEPVKETTSGKTEKSKKSNAILSESFDKTAGDFVGRGTATLTHMATAGADGKNGYLSVTGRTANWHGALIDLTGVVKPGQTYDVSLWVKYDAGSDSEVIKATQEDEINGTTGWKAITGETSVNKGEWTNITGTMTVDPNTSKCHFYVEANNLIDFYVDNIVIELRK